MLAHDPNADDSVLRAAAPCQITGTLLQHVRDAGADAAALAAQHGLTADAIGAGEVVISVEARAVLFDAAARLLGDPFLGLHLVPAFSRGHFGLLEYLTASAASVREAHQRLCQYGPLLNPRVRFTWTDLRDGRSTMRHRIVGCADGCGRHANELMIAGLVDRVRRNAAIHVERAWFAHPAPADTGELAAFLGTSSLEFDAIDNGYLLAPGIADLPMTAADERLSAIVREQADAVLVTRTRPRDLLDDVRAAVLAALPCGGSLLEHVATRLDTGSRTLQRHLRALGVRFHDVVADVRRVESQRLVIGTQHSLGAIARELGYTDLANFLRAFRRWTGTTPTELRRARRTAPVAK